MKTALIFFSLFFAKYAPIEAIIGPNLATNTFSFAVGFTFDWNFIPGTTTTIACAGAYLKTTLIITSAKCARQVDITKYNIYGNKQFSGTSAPTPFKPTAREINPSYNESTLQYNLGVLRVAAVAGVTPVKLPTAGEPYASLQYRQAVVVGPGRELSNGALPIKLKTSIGVIVYNVDCNILPLDPATIGNPQGFAKPPTITYICVNDYFGGFNVGDGGGLVLVKSDPTINTYDVLAGIYSVVGQTGNYEINGYSICERLTASLAWINSKMA